MRRLAALTCSLAIVVAAPAALAGEAAGTTAPPSATAAAKKKAKKKKCGKGKVRKTVRRGDKRVKRCVKKRRAGAKGTSPAPQATPAPTTPPPTTPAPTTPAPTTPTPPADTNATWRSMVSGASFTTSTYNATSGGSSKTVFNFCSDGGSFTYYYELVGSVYNEAKNRQGTYTLTRTEAGADAVGQFVDGLISYQSNIEERPSGQAVVRVYPSMPGRAYINAGDGVTEYSRTVPSGC